MTAASTLRFADPRRSLAGLARWASVVLPLACCSAAFADGDLVASSGVFGLASSLVSVTDADLQAFDAGYASAAVAAQAVAVETRTLPELPAASGQSGEFETGDSLVASPVVFRPARPRTAAEVRAASEAGNVSPASFQSPVRPSVKAPARTNEGPRPEATRPVTGDRPPMPFSRLVSQVQR